MGMPRLRAKSRSKAVYITGRSHSSAPAMITAVSAARAATSLSVTVTMLPKR